MGRAKEFMLAADEVLAPIAIRTGALEECQIHPHCLINQWDREAESQAYAMATNAWKDGEIGGSRGDVVEALNNLISMTPDHCSHCADIMAKD